MQIRHWAMVPVMALVASLGVVACGGGGGEPASDAEYVKAVCTTVSDLQAEMASLQSDLGSANDANSLQEAMNKIADVLDEAASRLGDVNPPADVKDSHEQVVQAFKDAAKAMEDGDTEALQSFDPGTIAPDQAVQDRLSAVASDVPECSGLGLF